MEKRFSRRDQRWSWRFDAVRRARARAASVGPEGRGGGGLPELIWSVGGPASAHEAGLALARRWGVPLVCQFQDPLEFQYPEAKGAAVHRYHERLERDPRRRGGGAGVPDRIRGGRRARAARARRARPGDPPGRAAARAAGPSAARRARAGRPARRALRARRHARRRAEPRRPVRRARARRGRAARTAGSVPPGPGGPAGRVRAARDRALLARRSGSSRSDGCRARGRTACWTTPTCCW